MNEKIANLIMNEFSIQLKGNAIKIDVGHGISELNSRFKTEMENTQVYRNHQTHQTYLVFIHTRIITVNVNANS